MARHVPSRIAIAVCLIATACAGSAGKPSGSAPADRFLARYATSDGRVIRHDQGGDIVSEGQAYGMLIAEIAGRPSIARTIWSWTDAHLLRSDGLLEFHATGSGQVEDADSAADADVLAGYALLRYRGPDQTALHDAGRRLAAAVLAHEAVIVGNDPVIVAGTWALNTSPPTVDPSYLMPGVFAALARLTGDARWQRAATMAVTLVRGLTGDGRRLPTDWAHLETGRLVPSAAPDGSAPVQYGLDAARLPLWFGTACSPDARRLAARWWTVRLARDQSGYLALSPEGAPINRTTHPVPLLAASAAAAAAGDRKAGAGLQHRAAQLAQHDPTYYGDAWLALSGALSDGTLVPCNEH